MEQRHRTLTSKIIGVAGAFGLTFAMACATTTESDGVSHDEESNEVAVGQTADPLGPPQHIESPITHEHPSSNTGAGNAQASGANTNLNQPASQPVVTVAQSDATVTQTPIIEKETVVVKTEPEPVIVEVEPKPVRTVQVDTTMDEDDEEVVTRRVTRKE